MNFSENAAAADELGSTVKKEPKQEEPQVSAPECNPFVVRALKDYSQPSQVPNSAQNAKKGV